MFRAACLLTLTLLSGCTSQPYLPMEGPVGTVTDASGVPAVSRNNQPYILARQSQIYIGDIISTDERSAVELTLTAGQVIDIPPHTQWLIIDMTSNGVDYKSSSSLTQGALQVRGSGELPHELTIRTAIAELQTLSNQFWLGYDRDGAGLTVAAMTDTPILVSNRHGTTTLTTTLQTTTIAPGVAPKNRVNWSEQKLRNTIDYYNKRQ